MKLAEALQERADLNIRLNHLADRLRNNALMQEGEKPAEDPAELLEEFNRDSAAMEVLAARINLTNCRTFVNGKTLTQLLAGRDALNRKLAVYRDLINSASQTVQRARHSEIRIVSSVDVQKLQKETDRLAKEMRLLDNSIQAANWQTDLIEEEQ